MKSKTLVIILCISLTISMLANTYQYKTNRTLKESLAAMEVDISALTDTISQLEQPPKEIYWTLTVEDYEIFLQEGADADTLNLMYRKDTLVSSLMTFHKEDDYQTPTDITAEAFTECLGHNGFCLYTRRSLGTQVHYYEVDYYAMDDELELLAYRWGSKDKDTYVVDVDSDGIKELVCNVTWLADGGKDVLIYHFDGNQVLQGHGSSLLEEPVNIHGVGSVISEYLPEKNKVHISYWNDATEGFLEAEYAIDLNKLELYEVFK